MGHFMKHKATASFSPNVIIIINKNNNNNVKCRSFSVPTKAIHDEQISKHLIAICHISLSVRDQKDLKLQTESVTVLNPSYTHLTKLSNVTRGG